MKRAACRTVVSFVYPPPLRCATGLTHRRYHQNQAAVEQRREYVSVEDVQKHHDSLAAYAGHIGDYADKEPTYRTVHEQLEIGRRVENDADELVKSAQFIQDEIPKRLAITIRSFQNLPYIVGVNPSINAVYVKCWEWFAKLHDDKEAHGIVSCPVDAGRFSERLVKVFEDHGHVLQNLRAGIKEVRALPSSRTVDFAYVDQFLNQFVKRRISWRVLAEHHLGLTKHRRDCIGVFNTKCQPARVGADCFWQAQTLCELELGEAPEWSIKGDKDTTFEYIDAHLMYTLHELMKNSLRATVNFHKAKGRKGPLPKVVMRICHGDEITVSIHDRGGGVSPELERNIWAYGFTTVGGEEADAVTASLQGSAYFPGHRANASLADMAPEENDKFRLAGWGFGLPVSRCYLEYLGGRIELRNMPGYGVDTIITLPKLQDRRFREHLDFV